MTSRSLRPQAYAKSIYARGFQTGMLVAQPHGEFQWGFAYDDVEFAFDVEVRVVDLNGNMSEPARVHIESADRGVGCMSATPVHSEWLLLPVLGLVLRRRRRR